ncbi:GNAT family N-acetyltransferase [Streptomyces sp. NPDC020965]|uniref:GNAT family N-acetyltransferase n=1 Tax=Streptomyces sp. NPDC020965 TaxID=3365105 RepID=UPI0037A3048D
MSPGEIDDSPSPHACARVLTDAFAREPAVSWICGSSATARRHWFTATLDTQTALPAARRYTLAGRGGRPVGAAVLTPPATTPSSIAQARWAARTFTRCGPRALGRTLRYLHTTEAEVPDGAWTLEFIGMAPAAAGRGGGRRLLDRLLADTPATAGVFLTTADPGNVPIYRHFGFDTLRHLTAGPLNITAMHRPATA